MKTTEQYFPVVLFIMLYKVFLTVQSVNKTLSTISLWYTVTYHGYAVENGANISSWTKS